MSSKRSNLIDVTYQQLHSNLSGHVEGATHEQIVQLLLLRADQLGSISAPFGKPSDASRKKIESGSVTLPDGVAIAVDADAKEFVFAISDSFQIDQVQALVLLRSFLYNEGLPPRAASSSATSLVDELVEAITPFYYSERISVMRVLIPLLRAYMDLADPVNDIATRVLPELLPDGPAFAESLIAEHLRKTQEKLPANVGTDPRKASRWAKQSSKEQLVMLEVLFWIMWGFVDCTGTLVVRIFEVAYDVNLGSNQENTTLLMDEEGMQLQQDTAALWMLIMLEILELENVSEPGKIDFAVNPSDSENYYTSPDSLKRIHELVISHSGSQFACIYLAWSFVLSRLTETAASLKSIPDNYSLFFHSLSTGHNAYSEDREPLYLRMAKICLDPETGLFKLIQSLLTNSPLFVTTISWKTGSTVTDPNVLAFRSVLKGLVMSLVELVPAELIPDLDSLIEVWIALFGRSESKSVAGICRQFWETDWNYGIARRAIFDVARSRFPIQFNPLARMLRAVTATGFQSTDPLSTISHAYTVEQLTTDQELCQRHVFQYLDALPTYSQVIPMSACTGPHALYEKVQERYGSPGLTYVTTKPTRLPGRTVLPARSTGRLLSGDGGDYIAIAWQHKHSGWKVILEVLTDYVNRAHSGIPVMNRNISIANRNGPQTITFRLADIGVEMGDHDETIITNALDLLHSVMLNNAVLAEELLESLEAGDVSTAIDHQPDLVQLTTMILEEALSRSNIEARISPPAQLITSAMSVLSALLPLHQYSNRVWLYLRSTSALFGSGHVVGSIARALSAERVTGHYTMTLALLHLVQQLFREASSSILAVLPGNPKLQQVKEEVLLRAIRFVHSEIWVEHLGWKYTQLGDKFEIGRRITSLYADVLNHAPYLTTDKPFSALSQAVADILLFRATSSTINPLVSSITSSGSTFGILYSGRRYGDARSLIFLLESHLQLTRLVLNIKQSSTSSNKLCLLEHTLCSPVSSSANNLDPNRAKVDPVDVLASYVQSRDMGEVVPSEAVNVLHALCSSLSSGQGSTLTIVSHLSDPEAMALSLIRIVQHPYDELTLRNAVWNFISLAVDKEPALASLFVEGQFRFPSHYKGKRKSDRQSATSLQKGSTTTRPSSALDVARDVVANWKKLWDLNPPLLAAVFRFLDVVWQHGFEHTATLDTTRQDSAFWEQLTAIACEELGPVPDYRSETNVIVDGVRHSHLYEAVAVHSYRTLVKSYALHVIGLDIGIQLQSRSNDQTLTKPPSYLKIETILKSEEQLTDLVAEAVPSPYDPQLHDELMEHTSSEFPALSLDGLRSRVPLAERELGDDFMFSISLLQTRLHLFRTDSAGDNEKANQAEVVERLVQSINLNISLTNAQTALAESWHFFLRQVIPFLRTEPSIRSIVLAIASSVSFDIASEKRSGDAMATIHGTRLALLLALLEVAWFATTDSTKEVQSFVELVYNVHRIILNESQPPAKSFLGSLTVPFHRSLLQIIYFCSRHSRTLEKRSKALNAEQRLTIASMHDAALNLVIDALRLVFDTARTRLDVELDRDMELLVVVFEQCTRPEVNTSSVTWLARCQETDVIRVSLELFVSIDLVGLSDLPLLLARRKPLYAPHILLFHTALTSIWSAAERVASAGILVAYRNNRLSPAIIAGTIDVTLPELPGERNPAHRVYCSMLAVISGLIGSLGRQNHFFDTEASGFVQLYGEQITRALSWTISDPLTFPLLEEIEQVVNLFYSIAESAPTTGKVNPAVEKVLRVFSSRSLLLLQQLNYALTHPNHLASVLEPITAEERSWFEKYASQSCADPLKRPLIASLVYRLLSLSNVIISTLISVSRADRVLLGQEDDWPVHEALVIPHSKVVLGEPASIGTLLELGNCTFDILRDLVGRPPDLAVARPELEKSLNVRQAILISRQSLEVVLVYAVTQLAMWLSKQESDASGMEMETDEQLTEAQWGEMSRERRAPRASLGLADRMRRGMTGEMGADLLALLTKAKPIIVKSGPILGKGDVDLTQVLSNFLQERVVTSS